MTDVTVTVDHGIEIVGTAAMGPQGPPGVGVPAGGTTGQVLAKLSGADYDDGWATLSGSTDPEIVRDVIGAALVAGAAIQITVNDPADTITIAVSGLTAAAITDFAEAVDDRVGALIVDGTNITTTYDDGANTLTIAVTGLTSSSLSDFAEAVQDQIGAHVKSGNTLATVTYDDPSGDTTLTVDTAVLDERIRDVIGTALVQGANVTITVNDPSDTITIAATGGGGSVATDAIWDAKGDLAGGTGADTADNLPVGANDTLLVAASGETTGLKWSTVASALAALLTTRGDIIRRGASAVERLALGAAGKVPRSDGTDIVYAWPESVVAGHTLGSAVVNTTAQTSLLSAGVLAIPAGRLAVGDVIDLYFAGDALSNGSGSNTFNFEAFAGATSIFSATTPAIAANATRHHWYVHLVGRVVSTSSIDWTVEGVWGAANGAPAWNTNHQSLVGVTNIATDFTAAVNIDFKITHSLAHANVETKLWSASIRHAPKVV